MEFVILDFGTIEKLEGKFLEAEELAVNTGTVVEEISLDLFRIEKTIFSSRGRRGGGSWRELKEDTIKRKGSNLILRSTDQLFESVTEPGAQFQILEVTNRQLIFGTDRPWAFVQQFGSAYKNRPARPFIRILPIDINRWTAMVSRHLLRPFTV